MTNVYQAVVLCLFNKTESITYSEIKTQSTVPEQELNQSLVFLCNPKMRVLLKENLKKPQFEENENVKINIDFSNNNLKCQFIPTQSHKKKVVGGPKTTAEIDDEKEIKLERQNIIDAVIVRIMKVTLIILCFRRGRMKSTTN